MKHAALELIQFCIVIRLSDPDHSRSVLSMTARAAMIVNQYN